MAETNRAVYQVEHPNGQKQPFVFPSLNKAMDEAKAIARGQGMEVRHVDKDNKSLSFVHCYDENNERHTFVVDKMIVL